MTDLTIIERVRRHVFGVTQKEMSEILRVSQGTLSKWEKGEGEPGLSKLGFAREAALARNLPWNDEWFFTGPPAPEAEQAPVPEPVR